MSKQPHWPAHSVHPGVQAARRARSHRHWRRIERSRIRALVAALSMGDLLRVYVAKGS